MSEGVLKNAFQGILLFAMMFSLATVSEADVIDTKYWPLTDTEVCPFLRGTDFSGFVKVRYSDSRPLHSQSFPSLSSVIPAQAGIHCLEIEAACVESMQGALARCTYQNNGSRIKYEMTTMRYCSARGKLLNAVFIPYSKHIHSISEEVSASAIGTLPSKATLAASR